MPVAILVWTQEGCPACDQFMPKFLEIAKEYSGCLPIIVANVEQFPGAADVFRVQSTPTAMITRYGRRGFAGFFEGDASEERIRSLFSSAANGLDCAI